MNNDLLTFKFGEYSLLAIDWSTASVLEIEGCVLSLPQPIFQLSTLWTGVLIGCGIVACSSGLRLQSCKEKTYCLLLSSLQCSYTNKKEV